jgi:hypothetical protein
MGARTIAGFDPARLARIASTVVEPVPSLDDDMAGMEGPLDADS